MRVMKAVWPILCAFVCGYSLHGLLWTADTGVGPATSITRWLIPVAMGLAAIEGVWRGLRDTPPSPTSN